MKGHPIVCKHLDSRLSSDLNFWTSARTADECGSVLKRGKSTARGNIICVVYTRVAERLLNIYDS